VISRTKTNVPNSLSTLLVKRPSRTKRRKTNSRRAVKVEAPKPKPRSSVSFQPLMDLVEWHDADQAGPSFDWLMDDLLPEYLEDRRRSLEKEADSDFYVSVKFENLSWSADQ
jgi:hypothetical protein